MGSVRGANGEVTEMSFKPTYIKAQEAEERIVALWRKEKGAYADTFNTAIDACQTIILDMYDNSSRDVVPVVRCKDCRYYESENHNCVDEMGYARIWEENDFCSFGERRQNDFEGGN